MDNAYKTDIKIEDENKLDFNYTVTEWVKKLKIPFGKAIVLDTKYLNTVRALVKARFKRKDIAVPNPFEDYEAIKSKHTNTHKMLLSQYLKHISKPQKRYGNTNDIKAAILDYCCTLDGNKDIKPIDDLKQFFNYHIPSKNSLLAVTLSWRNSKNSKGTYNDFVRLASVVTRGAHINGYNACVLPVGKSYKGSMFYSLFHIL